ncbi:MAG TPA: 2-octaprenyl-6-methoxyphenyl hydroxylase [Pseudomonadales bacterium]
MAHDADVVIIGGGMVGASLALLLPPQLNIIVVESHPLPDNPNPSDYQPSYDARSTALSYDSYLALAEAGLWPALGQRAQPISDVHVSDRGHWGSTHMSRQQQQWPALGYVVENAWLGRCLLAALHERSNITLLCPSTVTGIKIGSSGPQLCIDSAQGEQQVSAQLAVIADGATSASCHMLGIGHAVRDYGHTAIVANVSTAAAHRGIAWERFTDSGPMALLPLMADAGHAHRSALIWTLPSGQADALMALDDAAFLQQLQQRFGRWQGRFIHVGQRSAYPLKLSTAIEQIRQGIVVLGNAAHSLHPVAGQGFNLALRDVRELCRHIALALQQQQPIGGLAVLQPYLDGQQQDQLLTTVFSDVLPSLFSSRQPALQLGRNLGLLGLELLPPLKSSLVRFAAGIRHRTRHDKQTRGI